MPAITAVILLVFRGAGSRIECERPDRASRRMLIDGGKPLPINIARVWAPFVLIGA